MANMSPLYRRNGRALGLIVAIGAAIGASGPVRDVPRAWWMPGPIIAHAENVTPAPLPPGFRRYSSKVLPYSIGYPPGWEAQGSIFGPIKRPNGIYYDADSYGKRKVGSIVVRGEMLPPGSLLDSAAYREVAMLELQRGASDASFRYTAQRLGTIGVDGGTAYLLDVTRGTGTEMVHYTQALWVGRGKGWQAGVSTAGRATAHAALIPLLKAMLGTFRYR